MNNNTAANTTVAAANNNKKYELTDEARNFHGRTCYRIRAVRDFGDVKAGELGGFIEKEENLSHKGKCWVYDDAGVACDALVEENGKIAEHAEIQGNACIHGNAMIYGNALIYDEAEIYGEAEVYDEAEILDHASVSGHAKIYGNACVCRQAHVGGRATVTGRAFVTDDAMIYGTARICGNVHIEDSVKLCDGIIYYNTEFVYIRNFWKPKEDEDITYNINSDTWVTGLFTGSTIKLFRSLKEDPQLKYFEKLFKFIQEIIETKEQDAP